MPLRRRISVEFAFLLLAALACAAPSVHAQVPQQIGFLADHYDISATLDSTRQSISAVAKVEFKAMTVTGNLSVELHPNLIVSSVTTADGKSIGFGRDSMNPLYVLVTLPTPVATGGHVTLTFTYSGLLANAENSPVPGVTAAMIGHDSAYLLLPSRWFPLTDYPSNRYTATFHLNVPDNFAVAGSGKSSAPTPMVGTAAAGGGRLLYTFECPTRGPHGTFVAGNLQLNPKQSEGHRCSRLRSPRRFCQRPGLRG